MRAFAVAAFAVITNRGARNEKERAAEELPSAGLDLIFGQDEAEKLSDRMSLLRGVPHLGIWVDHVVVPPSDTSPFEVIRFNEVLDDPLRRPLRNPDPVGDVLQPDVAVLRDGEQYLCVVREERPRLVFLST